MILESNRDISQSFKPILRYSSQEQLSHWQACICLSILLLVTLGSFLSGFRQIQPRFIFNLGFVMQFLCTEPSPREISKWTISGCGRVFVWPRAQFPLIPQIQIFLRQQLHALSIVSDGIYVAHILQDGRAEDDAGRQPQGLPRRRGPGDGGAPLGRRTTAESTTGRRWRR